MICPLMLAISFSTNSMEIAFTTVVSGSSSSVNSTVIKIVETCTFFSLQKETGLVRVANRKSTAGSQIVISDTTTLSAIFSKTISMRGVNAARMLSPAWDATIIRNIQFVFFVFIFSVSPSL